MSKIDTILEGIEGLDKDVVSKVTKAFNEAVEEKTRTVVEQRLPGLKKKMYRSVRERARVAFNKTASALYNETVKSVNEDAEVFKEQIVQGLESFLETYMSEAIPDQLITEAAEANFNKKLVDQIKETIVIEQVMTDEKMKGVMTKALGETNRLKGKNNNLISENVSLTKEVNKYRAAVVFKQLTEGCTPEQRAYLVECFKGKDAKYIQNNFPSAKKLMVETLSRGTAPANDEKKVITEGADQKLKSAGLKADDRKKKVLKEQAAASSAKKKQVITESDETAKSSVMDTLIESFIDIQND